VPASAQTVIKIVANGIAITSYDIAQRTRLKQIANEKGGTKAATDELIDEAIQLYEAKRVGVTVSDEEVNNAFNSIAKQVKLTPSQFTQALGQQGVSAGTLKSRLRAQMAWHTLVQARAQRAAAVGSKEIEEQLAKAGTPKEETTSEFILKQILFVVPKGSSSGYVAQRRREAESFRIRFNGCDDAIAQTKGLRDVAVRDLGRRNSAELAGAQGNAIKATAIGKTTPPNTTDQGVELIAVCSKKQVQGATMARQEVENKLAQKQGEEVAAAYLKELKDKAVIEYR
jgi:peptidyl-prolyl cis-trans isomerase SurA